jgi:hypothetical protein
MPRGLSTPFEAALDAEILAPVVTASLDFQNDPLFAWSGLGELTVGFNTYIGLEGAFALEPFRDTSDTRISSLKCQLGYVQNGDLPNLETDSWEGRTATFSVVMLDPDDMSIIDSIEIFRGQMDTLSVEVKERDSVLTLTVVNEMTKLKQAWGATYSVADSLAGPFPDDTSMRFLPNIQGKKIQL